MPRGIAKAQYNADVVKRGTLTASLRLMKPAGRHEPAQPVHELLPSSGKRRRGRRAFAAFSQLLCSSFGFGHKFALIKPCK